MKFLFLLFIIFTFFMSYGQNKMIDQWNVMSKSDKRLLPKYGYLPKSKDELKADEEFIQTVMKQPQFNNNKRLASDEFIRLGFKYLNEGNYQVAMSRFNEAYLIDSTNTDIYWGFGAVHMNMQDFMPGRKLYLDGLKLNPDNNHILSELFFYEYYCYSMIPTLPSKDKLDSTLIFLNRAYKSDSTYENILFKLSICHLIKKQCDSAWIYYDKIKAMNSKLITKEFTRELKKGCKKR